MNTTETQSGSSLQRVVRRRECPHCHESLERYEDPKAVEIIGKLEAELRQETMRVDWLLARQYNHKTRESVDAEIFACGDCDPCLGGRPDQCAVMSNSPFTAPLG